VVLLFFFQQLLEPVFIENELIVGFLPCHQEVLIRFEDSMASKELLEDSRLLPIDFAQDFGFVLESQRLVSKRGSYLKRKICCVILLL